MADKKPFSKVRKLMVAGTLAGFGLLVAGCASGDGAAKKCGGMMSDKEGAGAKSCGADGKSCGGKTGDAKTCGAKTCGK